MAEVTLRVKRDDGSKFGLGIDYDAAGEAVQDTWQELNSQLPTWLQLPLDAFLFALRKGPLPRLLKLHNLPPMDKEKKNGAALKALLSLMGYNLVKMQNEDQENPETGYVHKAGEPFEVEQVEFTSAFAAVIRRVPELDMLPSAEPLPQLTEGVHAESASAAPLHAGDA